MLGDSSKRRVSIGVLLICIALAVTRVLWADATVPQGFDEPCHIAAGLNWLDKHDYTLDSVHPPLSRDAIALPLYLFGERFPEVRRENSILNGYCTQVGNVILNDGGHYARNLLLARLGILPFLCFVIVLVYLWTSREFGNLAGCFSVVLFSTLPSILAFSSLAYTDMPTACAQFACLFAFYLWLKQASLLRTLLLGAMAGLALSAKLTSGPFLLSACAAMVIVQFWFSRDALRRIWKGVPQLAAALVLALLVLWGFYSFSSGHIQQALNVDAPLSLTSVPSSVRSPISQLVRINPVIPAPELLRGVSLILSMNKAAPECYLLGRSKPGGWWYFFPVALALKSPIPFMLLAFVGFLRSIAKAPEQGPSALMPGVAIVAIFVATMFVSLRVGTRHVLVVLPLLAVLAGYGASFLWKVPGFKPIWGRAVLGVLLAWQMISSVQAQSDFLAYFNEFAPSDPSVALVKGCDLDCGQDLLRLSHELRSLHASHVNIGVWSSTDLSHLDLPPFDILQGDQPATGWVAVSVRALRTGQVVACKDGRMFPTNANPPGMLSWIQAYQPVLHIGKTILLYNIPETKVGDAAQLISHGDESTK